MKKTITICDYCGKEDLETWIEITQGNVRRYSGERINIVMGHYNHEIKDKLFCDLNCLEKFIMGKLPRDKFIRIDTFELGHKRQEDEAMGSLKLSIDDWETLLEFIDNFVDLPEDIKRIHGELEEQFVDMEETK